MQCSKPNTCISLARIPYGQVDKLGSKPAGKPAVAKGAAGPNHTFSEAESEVKVSLTPGRTINFSKDESAINVNLKK